MLRNIVISILRQECEFNFIRSTGPGGQNVNKVSSAVQLRFDVIHSPSIPPEVKERLVRLAGNRMTADGVLVIEAKRYRSQERNREEALQRLNALIQRAMEPPKARRPTRPSTAARGERMDVKKRRSAIKRLRQQKDWD